MRPGRAVLVAPGLSFCWRRRAASVALIQPATPGGYSRWARSPARRVDPDSGLLQGSCGSSIPVLQGLW